MERRELLESLMWLRDEHQLMLEELRKIAHEPFKKPDGPAQVALLTVDVIETRKRLRERSEVAP